MISNPLKNTSQKTMHLLMPFRQSRYFRALFLGQLVSHFGSVITSVLLPVIVLEQTSSTLAMGGVMSVYSLFFVIILPFSGIIVDRLNRVKVMLTVDLARFLLIGFITLLLLIDEFSLRFLFIIMAFMGCLDGLFQPAYAATKAKVFTADIRSAANSITHISNQAINLLGPTIGGLIITIFSAGIGLGIDAISYILSFFFILNLRTLAAPPQAQQSIKKSLSFFSDFMEGFIVLKQAPWLWITILAFSLINICTGGIMRIIVPWLMMEHHQFEAYIYGLIISASGIGSIISGFVFGMKNHWANRGIIAYISVAISAIALISLPFISSVPILMLLMVMEGAGIMMFSLIWETSLQEMVPEDKFGRVASLDMLGSFALLPVGYLLTGWGADQFGSVTIHVMLCISVLLIISLALMHKGVRKFD